jgi:predicted dehydrogenase
MQTQDRPLYRAGVIGCGSIGSTIEDRWRSGSMRMGFPAGHASVYVSHLRTGLVAGADLAEQQRQAFAERWQVPTEQMYASFLDMLDRENLAIVSVATPTMSHAEIGLDCVQRGVAGIYLEKPIASSLADADRLVTACADAGVPLTVNHVRRGDVIYRKARQLIDEGAIGEVHSMVAHFGGGLMWIGSHALDLLNYFNSDLPVQWISGALEDDRELDPGGSALMLYENGVRAFVNGSARDSMSFRVEVLGSAGRIVIGNHELELWRRNPASEFFELLQHPFPLALPSVSPMTLMLDELIAAIEHGAALVSNGETATRAIESIVGIYTSSRNGGSRISPTDLDRSMTIRSN